MGIPEIPPPNPIASNRAMIRHQQQVAAALAAGLIAPLPPATIDTERQPANAGRAAARAAKWAAIHAAAVQALDSHADPIERKVLGARYFNLLQSSLIHVQRGMTSWRRSSTCGQGAAPFAMRLT